jgi:hypothetical protein
MANFTLNGITYTLSPVYAGDTNAQIGWDLLEGSVRLTSFMTQSGMVQEGLATEPILNEDIVLKQAIDFISTTMGSLRERQTIMDGIIAILGAENAAKLSNLDTNTLKTIAASLQGLN